MKPVFERPRLLKDADFHYCPGCGHGIIHRLLAEVIDEMGLREDAICVAPAGCAMLPYNYFDIDMIEAAHGRGAAVATGIKRVRPQNIVFSYQGDGDLAAIGTAETIHAANRGENITVIFVNNAVYGMTGGQMAPTTLLDQVTTTTPTGRDADLAGHPMRICEVFAQLDGATYLERVAVNKPAAVVEGQEGDRQGVPAPARRRRLLAGRDPLPLPDQLEDGHPRRLHVDRRGHGRALPAGRVQGGGGLMLTKTIISGSGGQGVLSLGSTLATAAMLEGKHVTYLPSYGVEVRGGTANCTVAVADEEIASPVASTPEFVVAMNQPSFVRFQGALQSGGLLCANSSLVHTESARRDIEILAVPISELAGELGSMKVANMIMLGALVRASDMISYETMVENLAEILGKGRARLLDLNKQALALGYEYAKDQG